jgi:hypothetical protein
VYIFLFFFDRNIRFLVNIYNSTLHMLAIPVVCIFCRLRLFFWRQPYRGDSTKEWQIPFMLPLENCNSLKHGNRFLVLTALYCENKSKHKRSHCACEIRSSGIFFYSC